MISVIKKLLAMAISPFRESRSYSKIISFSPSGIFCVEKTNKYGVLNICWCFQGFRPVDSEEYSMILSRGILYIPENDRQYLSNKESLNYKTNSKNEMH